MTDQTNTSSVNTLKDDTSDVIDETRNRAEATGERAKRTVAGDAMSPGEKIGSHLKEAGHEIKAGVDKASRELRHEDDGRV
jgi:hypothetical protein